MKKFLLLMIALGAIFALSACDSSTGSGEFQVGYGVQSILPEESVPLGGFGNTMMRMSTGVLSECNARATVVTDESGETLVLIATDIISITQSLTEESKTAILAMNPEIKEENIIIEDSHTHSGVDQGSTKYACIQRYRAMFAKRLAMAVRDALADRAEATMWFAQGETHNLTFVRHILMNDGTYFGDNFGSSASGYKDYEDPADETMRLLVFKRENAKDIIWTFWQGHPTFLGRTNYDVSADFCGEYVKAVENHYNGEVYCVYFQGPCGEQNASRSIIEKDMLTADFREHGILLSEYAIDLYDNGLTELATGNIGVCWTGDYEGAVNHSEDYKLQGATLVQQNWQKYNDQARANEIGKQYGINSPYHAGAIINKFNAEKTKTIVGTGAFHIGDSFAGAIAPCEHFHLGAAWIYENSPYEHTVDVSYAANHNGYIPLTVNYEHGCYEVDNTYWAQGVAEDMNARIVECLKQLKSGATSAE